MIFNLNGPDFLYFYIPFAIAVLILSRFFLEKDPGKRMPNPAATHLSLLELAYLYGGVDHLIKVALIHLWQNQQVTGSLQGKSYVFRQADTRPDHQDNSQERPAKSDPPCPEQERINSILLQAVQRPKKYKKLVAYTVANSEFKRLIDLLHARLAALYLVKPRSAISRTTVVSLVVVLILLAVGGTKVYIGLERDKPVGHLIYWMCIFCFIGVPAWWRSDIAVIADLGERYLASEKERHRSLMTPAGTDFPEHQASMALATALFGLHALTVFPGLEPQWLTSPWTVSAMNPPLDANSSSGGGCGGGCSGGGGGGGGCGGCGGD